LKPYNKRAPRQVTLLQGKHRLDDEYLIQLQEVEDRDTAAKLRGATLYVREEEKVTPPVTKPEDPEEFIVSDLVNLEVYDQQTHNLVGKVVGVVLAEDMSSVPGLAKTCLKSCSKRDPCLRIAIHWSSSPWYPRLFQ
jgi:ribosomal 30S subunit maturation factor RimM